MRNLAGLVTMVKHYADVTGQQLTASSGGVSYIRTLAPVIETPLLLFGRLCYVPIQLQLKSERIQLLHT